MFSNAFQNPKKTPFFEFILISNTILFFRIDSDQSEIFKQLLANSSSGFRMVFDHIMMYGLQPRSRTGLFFIGVQARAYFSPMTFPHLVE